MNRLVYLLYAVVVILITTGINSSLERSAGGSYRSWGTGSSNSGSGSGSWSGGGHK